MWFVVQDDDGPFMTETASETDLVLFQGDNIVDAEISLQRACNGWESELGEGMNERFQ